MNIATQTRKPADAVQAKAGSKTTTADVRLAISLPNPRRAVKKPYAPVLTPHEDGTWTCPSERFGGFIEYVLWVDDDGGIRCGCESGSFRRPCKHGHALYELLHPPVVEVAPAPVIHLRVQTCPRCGAVAWMPAGWECSCVPPAPISITRKRDAVAGDRSNFTPAVPELMEAYAG